MFSLSLCLQIQVIVPWNEVVVLDDIVIYVSASLENESTVSERTSFIPYPAGIRSSCPDHDYDLLHPVVMVTSLLGVQGDCPDEDAVLVETQAVQESVKIPGTDLQLIYHSSRLFIFIT